MKGLVEVGSEEEALYRAGPRPGPADTLSTLQTEGETGAEPPVVGYQISAKEVAKFTTEADPIVDSTLDSTAKICDKFRGG